jgi:FkbM family methyltransferase
MKSKTDVGKLLYDKYFKTYTLEGQKYYAEIGSGDGITNNNTKYYEDTLSWSGILLEPNVYTFSKLIQTRPKNILVNIVVSDQKEPVEFNMCASSPELSCVEMTKPDNISSYYNSCTIYKYTTLPVLLDTILKKSTIPRIDLCVVDVCGHELNVLKSFGFTYPVVLWVINLSFDRDNIMAFMTNNNCNFMEQNNDIGIFINNNYLEYF